MNAFVRVERDPATHITRITLDRPGDGNMLSIDMVKNLGERFREASQDDDVKVIVVEGAGDDLTRGFDPSQVEQMYKLAPGGALKKVPSQRARLLAQDALWWGPDGLYTRILHCPKVTVLIAKGACLEIGLYLSLCCDVVVAADTARFGNPRWRHVGVDGDISMLVAAVGLKRAKELMLFGREWSAREAHEYGLVDEVVDGVDLEAATLRIATTCAQVMRDGIAAEKHVVFASLAKMQIGTGFATAAAVGAWASNIHFREGEFNFLREARKHGTDAALEAADRFFAQ